jgi:propionate CoA-transferase
MGVGGFANISAVSNKAIFIGTFTAGGIETKVENGKMVIVKEGRFKKFVIKCPQLTYNAEQALRRGSTILYVTERCVLQRTKEGMILKEIAPGIDLQTQILDQMEYKPIIPEGGPKLMNPDIFQETWGGLKDFFYKK